MELVSKLPALDFSNIVIPKKLVIQKHEYSVIKIIPYKTGYGAKEFEKILNTFTNYNKTFFERFEFDRENKQLIYHPKQSMCYEILFTKDKITYCYAIENIYKNVFMNKIKFILDKCDVVEVEDYIGDFDNSIRYRFDYKKNSLFSINTDDKTNVIDSLMILNKDLGDNDKVLLQYSMIPLFDNEWKNKWENKFTKFCETGQVQNEFNALSIIDSFTDLVLEKVDIFIYAIMSSIGGINTFDENKSKENFSRELSSDSKHKGVFNGFKCNLNMYIKSDNILIVENVARNTHTILQDISGDNSFKISKKGHSVKFAGRATKHGFISSSKECVQLIRTPSENMMKEYDDILDKVNVADIEMPKDLFKDNGIILGDMMKGSSYRQITFGSHANSISKPFIYISPQEGGKSTFIRTYAISALEQGHSVFVFDTIDGMNVQIIRDHLTESFPDEKIIVLNFRDNKYAFLLMWNEISENYFKKLKSANDEFERYQILEEFGSLIGGELLRFIDTFQAEDIQNRLTPAMRSTLSDLAQLVFMNNGNIGQIKDCLYDTKLRHKLLDNLDIPKGLPFSKSILKLDDDLFNATTIKGIETRLNLIMNNPTLKKYFSLKTNKKLDFAHFANNGYCVLIQIPEGFSDVIITFLVQKLWLAVTSSRYNMAEDDRPHTHLLIDEPNKFPSIMNLLTDHFIASRKWHLRFVMGVHNLQIFRGAWDNLKSAGVSIMMLPTNTMNFSQVAEFFQPYDYSALKEVEKLIAKSNGKVWYALCSIHYKNVNYPCVVKLPQPVENRYKMIDRSYINNICAEKYGVSQREYYMNLFNESDEDVSYDIDNEEGIV